MNWLEQLLLFFTYCNLAGNKWNVCGVIWLITLTYIFYSRFKDHFQTGFLPKPSRNPLNKIWFCAIALVAFYMVFVVQMLVDDFITTPINIVFGSWYLIAPHLGEFSFMKWLMFKWDVYMMILVILLLFYGIRLHEFLQFTKWSAVWLTLTVSLQLVLASQGIFYFLNLQGHERIFAYWTSYPWFRILTGLFAVSIIKKRGKTP